MEKMTKATSKYLSYILRHNPGDIGLELDHAGWASMSDLLSKANDKGKALSEELIKLVVETNDKQRFAISSCGQLIRANQGHSIEIDLELPPTEPPALLYHGTAEKFINAIEEEGLKKRQRHHVHLTENIKTAQSVGSRYGKLILLKIDTQAMVNAGVQFFQSANGVWLTDEVPPQYLSRNT